MRSVLLLALLCAGCGDTTIVDPMERQPKFRAFAANPLYEDGRAMRNPPEGTVPRERPTMQPEITTGRDRNGQPVGAILAGTLGTALGVRPAIWIMAGVVLGAGALMLASPLARHPRPPHGTATPARPHARWLLSRRIRCGVTGPKTDATEEKHRAGTSRSLRPCRRCSGFGLGPGRSG